MELSTLEKRIMEEVRDHGIWEGESALARKLKISRETLAYKMDRLAKEGVITGYNLRLNPFKLGFRELAYVLFTMERGSDVDELYSKILEHNHVVSAMLVTGDHDFASKVLLHDSRDLHGFMAGFPKGMHGKIENMHVAMATRVYKLNQVPLSRKDVLPDRVDDKDLKLLGELFADPIASVKQLADRVKMHRNTVARRLNELYKSRVILKLAARVGKNYYSQLGMGFWSLLQVDAEAEKIDEVAARLAAMPEVHELYSTTGPHDLMAITRVRDASDYGRLGRRLFSVPHVKRIRTSVIFQGDEKPLPPPQAK